MATETTDEVVERPAYKALRTGINALYLEVEPSIANDILKLAEAALREALRIGREQAAKVADKWAESQSCRYHDDNPCCHVRTGAGIAAAIRNLSTEE